MKRVLVVVAAVAAQMAVEAAELVSVTNRFESGCKVVLRYPKGEKGYPTLLWAHGGGLDGGRADFRNLEDDGIAQVSIDYRLMKKDGSVTAADCIDDTAEAVAWALESIEAFGGDSKKIYLSGWSAGGYLAMMVGMDPRWLAKRGHKPTELAGIIPVSGQATKHFNVRRYSGDREAQFLPKIDEWAPLAHVTNAIPPILSICGQPPYEWKCRAEENRLMIASLVALGHKKAYFAELPGCTHGGVVGACGPYIRDFIRGEYTPAKRK